MSKHNTVKPILITLQAVVLALAMSERAAGQAANAAQLRGTILDSSGAVVPQAAVTATNIGTQVSDKEVTDEMGRYIFNGLAPAVYQVKVEAQGFKAVLRENVELRVDQQTDLDFTLEVGQITQTIEVQAAAPLLDTVNATLGTQVTNRYTIDVAAHRRPTYLRGAGGLRADSGGHCTCQRHWIRFHLTSQWLGRIRGTQANARMRIASQWMPGPIRQAGRLADPSFWLNGNREGAATHSRREARC